MYQRVDYSKASSASVPYKGQAEDEARLSLPLRHLDAKKKAVALRRLAIQHFNDDTPLPPEHRLAFEPLWRRYFVELNWVVRPQAEKLAWTDVGFIAICWARVAENPHPDVKGKKREKLRDFVSIQGILSMHVFVCIFSSQHSVESRSKWPDADEFTEFQHVMAHVVVAYFDITSDERYDLIQHVAADAFEWQPVQPDLRATYTNLVRPADMVAAKAARVKAARAAHERKKLDPRDFHEEEISDEVRGFLWRESPEELISSWIYKCARFCLRFQEEEELLALYKPTQDCIAVPELAFTRALVWINVKCRNQQTEEVTELFRALCMKACMPLGSDTAQSRNKKTASNVVPPLTALQDQIGAEITPFLQETTLKVPMAKIVSGDREGLYWNSAFMAILAYHFMQTISFDWRKVYVCTEPWTKAWQERFANASYHSNPRKRPVIVYLCRDWWIFYKQKLRPCDSMLHAVLCWFHVLGQDFRTSEGMSVRLLLENGEDVYSLFRLFF